MREAFCQRKMKNNVERVANISKVLALVLDWTVMNLLAGFRSLKVLVQI